MNAETVATKKDPLLERLQLLESGQVSDVLDEAGLPNHALSSHITPIIQGQRIVGRAACVAGDALLPTVDSPPPLPGDTLEQVVGPNSILVIATGGFRGGACIGGFVAYSLQREGCRGMITDGAIRDADEIRSLAFPVYAAAVTPINAARRWRLVAMNSEVLLPGAAGNSVRIKPGDLILGDADGVVVVPAEVAEQVVGDAEELKQIETRIAEALRAGGSRAEVFKANPRFAHIRKA